MRLKLMVAPRSSKNEIIKLPDGSFKVKLTAAPVDGAANVALIKLLSKEFGVAKSQVKIVKGARGKKKVVEVTFPLPLDVINSAQR